MRKVLCGFALVLVGCLIGGGCPQKPVLKMSLQLHQPHRPFLMP